MSFLKIRINNSTGSWLLHKPRLIYYLLYFFFVSSAYAQSFSAFIERLNTEKNTQAQTKLIGEYLSHHSVPVVESTAVHFVYRGKGKVAAAPSELCRWNPDQARMQRVSETNLFYRTETVPINGRVEYKIWVDSVWMLDPLNKRTARGGYGENSDAWMPEYKPPSDAEYNPDIPHGRIDTFWIESNYLKRKHPLFIYTPAVHSSRTQMKVFFVTDGGDYLAFGGMKNILDNLIAAHRIKPIVAVFIDPRTNPSDNATNHRMTDYGANDAFLDFLEKEAAPFVEERYTVSHTANERVIMGASMGGLIATYAVLKRPEFAHNCAAQSPAFWQAESAVVKLAREIKSTDANIYMDTGNINNTQVEARLVSGILKEKGAKMNFAEYPEGHNWTNWRARIGKILEYFANN